MGTCGGGGGGGGYGGSGVCVCVCVGGGGGGGGQLKGILPGTLLGNSQTLLLPPPLDHTIHIHR